MAKYLFIDTETTGLAVDWEAPIERVNNWPRLVQIAWLICGDDGQIEEEKEYIIFPDNFVIPEDAFKVHKISTELATVKGSQLNKVLLELNSRIEVIDYIVAHNISFDEKIIGAEFYRKRIKTKLFSKNKICTMTSSTNYCEIPGNYGYKWPSLTELHQHLFNSRQEESHNALVDIKTTFKCFWKLNDLGIIKTKNVNLTSLKKNIPELSKVEHVADIEHVITNENKEYLNFWNSINDDWKNLIIQLLPVVKNPNYVQFGIKEAYFPPFDAKKKLNNNDITILKTAIENTRSITIENSKSVSDTKFDSIEPLKYFINLESLTIKEFLHLKEKKQISDLSPLSRLKHLRTIIIECSPICNIDALSELNEIETLEISHTNVTSLIPIRNFKQLKKLKFTCSPVTSIEPLRELGSLRELVFGCSTSTINDITALSNLTNLKFLSITHNPIYDISSISNLKNLETLFLSWTPVSNISALSNLSKLKVLWLGETKITSLAPILNLKELVRLYFDKTQITDIEPILNLPKLKWISCNDSMLTNEQIEKLHRQYPNATINSNKTKNNSGCLSILFLFSLMIILFLL